MNLIFPTRMEVIVWMCETSGLLDEADNKVQ